MWDPGGLAVAGENGRRRRSNILVPGRSFMNPLPTGREGWLIEIARALRDASEAIPFGPLPGRLSAQPNSSISAR